MAPVTGAAARRVRDGGGAMDEMRDWMTSVRAELDALRRQNAELEATTRRLHTDNERLRVHVGALLGVADRTMDGNDPADLTATATGPVGSVQDDRPVSRRGMIAAAAAAAGGMLLANAAPAAAANGDQVRAGWTTSASDTTKVFTNSGSGLMGSSSATTGYGVIGSVSAETGNNAGVYGYAYSDAGIGVKATAEASVGATYGVHSLVRSTSGTGVYGVAIAASGTTYGVRGLVASSAGAGVFGEANSGYGVHGQVWNGSGVRGHAKSPVGTTYGVSGLSQSSSGFGVFGFNPTGSGPSGMAVFAAGRLKVTGRSYLAAPGSAPSDADLDNGSVSFFLNEATDKLKVRVRYSNGTFRTATIGLV